jgi:ABC-type phosphate transport system substrate-binding protein
MPTLRLRHLALLFALAVSAACASASQNGPGKSGKITPPQQLRAGPRPEIREEVDLRYEVLVDAEGQPDMSTLKVTGKGSSSVRGAIEEWIRSSVFKPGMQDGHPVAALYKGGIKSRVEVRRM